MKYFMPDWEDKVDPTFDFQADEYTPDRNVSEDVYAHEIFQTPPYDGILLSRAVVEKSRANYEALQKQGAHRYLRLPKGLEVFGDCGAFSYVNEKEPWYETDDVLEYYDAIRVDYGASVDHLVVKTIYVTEVVEEKLEDGTVITRQKKQKKQMTEDEYKRRIQLTLENAREFIRLHRKRRYKFTPVGVAQGWTPDTYADSVKNLLKMGYTYIALGGLARSPASQVLDVLKAAKHAVDEFPGRSSSEIRFHLFGVAKLTLIDELPKYSVASIDSASYLRKAWLRSGQNYLGVNGQWYTAIRVPQSDNPKVQEYIRKNGKSLEEVQAQEQFCLRMLQRYSDAGLSDAELDQLLDAIVEYDTYLLRFGDDGQSLRNKTISKEKYRRTLEAKPWESCPCEVCQSLGVHVLIFRGTNRNKRRGFHNTWAFYQRLRICGEASAPK
jgi:hypothetical protein